MGNFIPREDSSRILKVQATAITSGTVSQAGSAFSAQTYQIRVATTLPSWFRVGDGAQTASANTDTLQLSSWVDYYTVTPGQSYAFISTSTSSGYFVVTEMT
jgi:hypothetical protein